MQDATRKILTPEEIKDPQQRMAAIVGRDVLRRLQAKRAEVDKTQEKESAS